MRKSGPKAEPACALDSISRNRALHYILPDTASPHIEEAVSMIVFHWAVGDVPQTLC